LRKQGSAYDPFLEANKSGKKAFEMSYHFGKMKLSHAAGMGGRS